MKTPSLAAVLLCVAGLSFADDVARAPVAPCGRQDALDTREKIVAAVPAGDAWTIALANQGLYQKEGQWWRRTGGGEYTIGVGGLEFFRKALSHYCSELAYKASLARPERPSAPRTIPTSPDYIPASAGQRQVKTDDSKIAGLINRLKTDLAPAAGDPSVLTTAAGGTANTCLADCTRVADCDLAGIAQSNGGGSHFHCRKARAAIVTNKCTCPAP